MKKENFLFLIIFLEGYVVLSSELLAIRQTIPYVGSGTDTVSIIIAAVLMPLAFGYFAGGQFTRHYNRGQFMTVRRKLLRNIFISSVFFLLGLSHILIQFFFEMLTSAGIQDRLLLTTIYSIIFLVIPVYLLAQTIPLVSHFFKKEQLNEITGKMLFFSTMGSFLGAIFSTLILMSFIGVHHTAVVTVGCLTLLYITLSSNKLSSQSVIVMCLFGIAIILNSNDVMRSLNIVENNKYNTIKIVKGNSEEIRVMMLNNNSSSLYAEKPAYFEKDDTIRQTHMYAHYINQHYINPTLDGNKTYSILIIGAGGFTIGLGDEKNDYTFIDIDGSLKDVSEKYFLKHKLSNNKKFIATPARAFIYDQIQQNKQYDFIILDAYQGAETIPEHLVTQEFYASVRQILAKNGIMLANMISSEDFNSVFSVKLDNTLRRVFPHLTRQVMARSSGNSKKISDANILYIFHNKEQDIDSYYTDNKNTIHYDKNKVLK